MSVHSRWLRRCPLCCARRSCLLLRCCRAVLSAEVSEASEGNSGRCPECERSPSAKRLQRSQPNARPARTHRQEHEPRAQARTGTVVPATSHARTAVLTHTRLLWSTCPDIVWPSVCAALWQYGSCCLGCFSCAASPVLLPLCSLVFVSPPQVETCAASACIVAPRHSSPLASPLLHACSRRNSAATQRNSTHARCIPPSSAVTPLPCSAYTPHPPVVLILTYC